MRLRTCSSNYTSNRNLFKVARYSCTFRLVLQGRSLSVCICGVWYVYKGLVLALTNACLLLSMLVHSVAMLPLGFLEFVDFAL